MDKGKAFFESFNMAVEAAYNKYFDIAEKDILKGIREDTDLLDSFLASGIEKWESTCLSELDGYTPIQYIEQVNDFNDIMKLFHLGAVMCDDRLPSVFLKKLESFGEVSIEALLELSRKSIAGMCDEDEFQASQLAVKILGIWRCERAVIPLIELLFNGSGDTDLLYENIKEALVGIGKPAIPVLIQYIESDGFKSEVMDYLLMALSDIGEKYRSDEVYKCLKNAFVVMPDKAIGAICLGNYGDGRVIPALRGFLEKNKETLEKEVFYEIISAIKKLGGNTEDISF